jgi:hypothetical protein
VAHANPSAGIFVIIHADQNVPPYFVAEQRTKVGQAISGNTEEESRLTYLDCQSNDNSIDIWLVPPGATPPTCQASGEPSKQQTCPTVTVTGPAGITLQHGIATFTASVQGPIPPNLMTRWSVEGADIVRQSRFSVDVTAENFCVPVTATIIIDGLPLF